MPNTKTTNRSYRYGVEPEVQGIAFIENTGDDWVLPSAKCGGVEVYDDDGQPHMLLLDMATGFFFDLTTRDGPAGSGITKAAKDQKTKAGTGGTAISCVAWFREHRGTYEKYLIESKLHYVYVRPEKESNRSESGYDSDNGLPSNIEFDLDVYEDGEPTTAQATASDIDIPGAIAFDKYVEAYRLQLKLTASEGEHLIVGIQSDDIAKNRMTSPANLTTTAMDYQKEFAAPTLWVGYKAGNIINRVTGSAMSITATQATGPDSDSGSAMQISAATNLGDVGSMAGNGTILIWHNGTITVTIGGIGQTLTTHDTSGSWTLSYISNVSNTGDLIVTPTGTVSICDPRAFTTAITAGARGYYYDDVIDNDGRLVMRRGT